MKGEKMKGYVTILRVVVGWHFLYEGCWKLLQSEGWSCVSFIGSSQGPLSPLFTWMSQQPVLVAIGDWSVMLGLVAIGLGLITGVLARVAAFFGILLMLMFYCCQPPEPFATAFSGADGRFFVIERNIIEACALLAIVVTPCWRGFLRTLLPGAAVLAVFVALVAMQWFDGAFKKVEAVTSATVKVHEFTVLSALKAPFADKTEIAGAKVSRLAFDGDLMAGHAHGRDLIWTDEFMARYHRGGTLERTVRYALFCGVDAAFVEPQFVQPILSAAEASGGKMTVFASCATADDAMMAQGAKALYVRPEVADDLAARGDVAAMKALVEALRQNGAGVGIGAEKLETVEFAVRNGISVDFWVVAFHSLDYPAARIAKPCNSIWCADPEKTAAYMRARPEPWVAIRGTAGGAFAPEVAYDYARKHGAAVVALDLLDYRFVDTVNAIKGEKVKR